jgi:alpha-mannosidase
VLEFERPFGASKITQQIIVRAGSARVDFDTTVDWQERDRTLKVSFPLAIRTDQALFEIQSGHVRRPVHRNTSWDAARFEVPMQRWVDLSESDRGVALLNNGIFGCDVLGNRVRLTLLKSASAPDPKADIGIHRRTFSLFPHAGQTTAGGVIEEALNLNVPLIVTRGAATEAPVSWLTIDQPGIVLEAFKRAEDGRGIVLRLNESHGRQATVNLGSPLLAFAETDLLENPLADAAGGDFRPFDLRSYRSV